MADRTPNVEESDDVPASPETPSEAGRDAVARLSRENEELLTKLKYLQAEFENYRKRAERDADVVVRFAHEALVARLLPVLDEMDAAMEGLAGKPGAGVRMVRDNFLKALQEAGLQEIPAAGLSFDPYVMDCVQRVPNPTAKDGVVKEVVRKGYRLHDRILRPVQVIVVNNGGEPDA